MGCKRVLLIVIAIAIGCASAKYRVEREHLDCEDANEQVRRTLVNLDYEITRFDPATPVLQGVIEARRETPDGLRYGRIRIDCAEKTTFQPVEGAWFLPTYDFSRDVYFGLLAAGELPIQPDVSAVTSEQGTTGGASPWAAGRKKSGGQLRVIFRALGRFEVRKETGVDLVRRGLLVVRVAVVNQTPRAYILRAGRIVLVDEVGERVRPLGSAEITALLERSTAAPENPDERPLPQIDIAEAVRVLDEKLLTSGRIGRGETRDGLLYFPPGDYSSGRLRLIDEETGEVEGTIVAF